MLVVGSAQLVELEPARRGGRTVRLHRPSRSRTRPSSTDALVRDAAHDRDHRRRLGTRIDGAAGWWKRSPRFGPVDVVERDVVHGVDALHPARGGALMALPLRQQSRVGRYCREAEAGATQAVPAASSSSSRSSRATSRARAAARSSTRPRSSGSGVSVDEAVAAIEECGAPMVSIAGGEPLLHPEIDEMVQS